MKITNLLLTSTLLLAALAGCSSTSETTPTTPATSNPSSSADSSQSAPQDTVPFEIPEHYAHLDAQIATIFCSIQNMEGYRYVPNMPLEAEMMTERYNISSDLYTAYYGELSAMGTQPDMLLLFRTDDTATLEAALQEILATEQANLSQYPSTLAKLEVAEVGTYQDYVYFNMLSSYPENEGEYDETAMSEFFAQTTAAVTAEIQRIIDGGEANPPRQMDGSVPDDDWSFNEDVGGFQTPNGDQPDFVPDENFMQPATPPQGSEGDVMPMVPAMGEPTSAHAPSATDNAPAGEGQIQPR